MTLVLQPFLSEVPAPVKTRNAPVGTFTAARVSRNTAAPWSMQPPPAAPAQLPKGIVVARKRGDMSRHATVVLT